MTKRQCDDDFDPKTVFEPVDIGTPIHWEEVNAMGIDPRKSTRARPGTEEKVQMLSARYAAGLSLWDDRDRYDHGPKERELMGAISDLQPLPLPLPDTDYEGDSSL